MTNPAAKTRTSAGSTTSMITAALAQRKARGGSAVMLSWRNQPERRSRASCAPPPIAAPSDPYAAIEIMIMAAQLIPLPSSAVPYIRVKTTYKINGIADGEDHEAEPLGGQRGAVQRVVQRRGQPA